MIEKHRELGNTINDLVKLKDSNGDCDGSEYT